ncbi:MAG: glycoside hydrolase [Planctomycetia bacterium]|nr:glycoside hydrolase [Planctomycetia bacterium]
MMWFFRQTILAGLMGWMAASVLFAEGMLERNGVRVRVADGGGALTITDTRTGTVWEQDGTGTEIAATDFQNVNDGLTYLLNIPGMPPVQATLTIPAARQVELTLSGGDMPGSVVYPGGWKGREGDDLVLPIGSGTCWPMTLPPDADVSYLTLKKSLFWSRNLSMGMWAVLRGDGWMVVGIREASDATLEVPAVEGKLRPIFRWEPERGKWGYPRTVRFLFGDTGGLTAACHAYREFRLPDGFTRTLREKAKNLPHLEKLAGAANVWLWHDDYATLMYGSTTEPIDVDNRANIRRIASEMKAAGMDRVLWGIFFQNDAPVVPFLSKELGFLTTKYDNYQDVLPKELQEVIPPHRVACCDFMNRRNVNWPDDMIRDAAGNFVKCWALYGTDGKKHHQHAMCQRQAEPYIRRESASDREKYGYTARLIDCMGTHLSQCFAEKHPMTRRQCRQYSLNNFQALLDLGLLSGTEEGVECFLPALAYAEGRMSVFPYRIEPSMCWRYKSDFYADANGEKKAYLEKYMLSPIYRVPLWALVYHECSVDYWYWGDACNTVPEAMDRRDLFHVLYGVPPMYSFKTRDWPVLKERILRSYARSSGVTRKVCLEPMVSFAYLTPDRLVQRTTFGDGTSVWVNFSENVYQTADGISLPPNDFFVRSPESNEGTNE